MVCYVIGRIEPTGPLVLIHRFTLLFDPFGGMNLSSRVEQEAVIQGWVLLSRLFALPLLSRSACLKEVKQVSRE